MKGLVDPVVYWIRGEHDEKNVQQWKRLGVLHQDVANVQEAHEIPRETPFFVLFENAAILPFLYNFEHILQEAMSGFPEVSELYLGHIHGKQPADFVYLWDDAHDNKRWFQPLEKSTSLCTIYKNYKQPRSHFVHFVCPVCLERGNRTFNAYVSLYQTNFYNYKWVHPFLQPTSFVTEKVQGWKTPKVFWINMKQATDRRDHMILQLQGIDHTRVEAYVPETTPEVHMSSRLSLNEIACTCSHLKALAMGSDLRDPYFVIMEDDVVVPQSFWNEKLPELLQKAPEDWEILQMTTNNPMTAAILFNTFYIPFGIPFMRWKPESWGAMLYIVKTSYAKKLVKCYTNPWIWNLRAELRPVADILVFQGGNVYTSCVPWAYCLDKDSYIHPQHVDSIHKRFTTIAKGIHRHLNLLTASQGAETKTASCSTESHCLASF